MVVSPEKKERIVKSDWCDPNKDLPTVKSLSSLERRDGK